jgi:hypothetical protein
VSQHLLASSYRDALLAVVVAQFSGKRVKGGMWGVLKLVHNWDGFRRQLEDRGARVGGLARVCLSAWLPSLECEAHRDGALPCDASMILRAQSRASTELPAVRGVLWRCAVCLSV